MSRKNRRTDNDMKRVKRVQELRQSNAAGPIPAGTRYDRNAARKMMQRKHFDRIED